MLNIKAIEKQVSKLHANAKDGSVKINGIVYCLDFDQSQGVYIVTEGDSEITRFNTRKVTVAKQWLKEYLSN